MIFWLNGSFEEDKKAIDIRERGFLLGDGVFETILIRNGVAAFQGEHFARLRRGMDALKIVAELPADIGMVIEALIKKSGLENVTASWRVSVARGPAKRGLKFFKSAANPTILMTVQAAPTPMNLNAHVTLNVSKFVRSEKSITARHKTLNYLDNIMAQNDASDAGADDAIMLNSAGRVACASMSNIYVMDVTGAIRTPPIEEGALPGIVRALLLESGAEIGIDISEAPIELDMLQGTHLFLSNSIMGVRPAVLFGKNNIWPPSATNILRRLQTWYDDRLGNDLAARALK